MTCSTIFSILVFHRVGAIIDEFGRTSLVGAIVVDNLHALQEASLVRLEDSTPDNVEVAVGIAYETNHLLLSLFASAHNLNLIARCEEAKLLVLAIEWAWQFRFIQNGHLLKLR